MNEIKEYTEKYWKIKGIGKIYDIMIIGCA